MKFAHIADCHIGSWRRDKVLNNISKKYFIKAVDVMIDEKVDFVLIAGDLFDSAVPNIDSIKIVVEQLKRLKDNNIPVYFIAGSHDFSPSGKTMLDVLEKADLGKNVFKYDKIDEKLKLNVFIENKTNTAIVGLLGKKGALEKKLYANLYKDHFKNIKGFKIFMFHSALDELKPSEMKEVETMPITMLPEGFDYYAGGHVHIVKESNIKGYDIVFPGPVFPNNFNELETLKNGGFYIVEDNKKKFIKLDYNPVYSFKLDCSGKTPSEVEDDVKNLISLKSFEDGIITLRLQGILLSGRPSDINFNDIVPLFHDAGALVVLKNTRKLFAKTLDSIKIDCHDVSSVEEEIIKEHESQNIFNDAITKSLINALSVEKIEGEKNLDYEKRVFTDVENLLETNTLEQ